MCSCIKILGVLRDFFFFFMNMIEDRCWAKSGPDRAKPEWKFVLSASAHKLRIIQCQIQFKKLKFLFHVYTFTGYNFIAGPNTTKCKILILWLFSSLKMVCLRKTQWFLFEVLQKIKVKIIISNDDRKILQQHKLSHP